MAMVCVCVTIYYKKRVASGKEINCYILQSFYFITDTNRISPKKQQSVVEKQVDLKEVITVLNGVYGGSRNIEKEESTFPLQQKLLLCSHLLILNKGRNKDVTVGRVS